LLHHFCPPLLHPFAGQSIAQASEEYALLARPLLPFLIPRFPNPKSVFISFISAKDRASTTSFLWRYFSASPSFYGTTATSTALASDPLALSTLSNTSLLHAALDVICDVTHMSFGLPYAIRASYSRHHASAHLIPIPHQHPHAQHTTMVYLAAYVGSVGSPPPAAFSIAIPPCVARGPRPP
jgi:hypothetical protein